MKKVRIKIDMNCLPDPKNITGVTVTDKNGCKVFVPLPPQLTQNP